MQDLVASAAELLQHVLERPEPRLVGACPLGGEHRVERRPQLLDVAVDLALGGVRQDHQRNVLRHLRQRLGHVGMRSPVGDVSRDLVTFRLPVLDRPTRARAAQRILDDVRVTLPGPEHLVDAVGLEVVEKFFHPRRRHPAGEQGARQGGHLEVRQRSVEVERDELRSRNHRGHVRIPSCAAVIRTRPARGRARSARADGSGSSAPCR